ncbi:MAG: NAD(+)/NADH kinase [Thermoleophilia bacterium]|nr:NAD(+)/NADH kinase [Thermoleophilia bacterium]
MTHGKPTSIGGGLGRLERAAAAAGVELLFPEEEAAKHGLTDGRDTLAEADLAVALGGDGTMLRALNRFLGSGVPVIGVNFGRVGFLASVAADELEPALARAFAGDFRVVELPTLRAEAGGEAALAVNDVVARSSDIGRMVELGWRVGGEAVGSQPCDGMICAAPAGSTAYNLSNGGPVLVWGLDAIAVSFVAPHSLHARPLVVPRGLDVSIENRTSDVTVTLLVDGHSFAELEPGGSATVRLGEPPALLATLPEATFFRRYRDVFAG